MIQSQAEQTSMHMQTPNRFALCPRCSYYPMLMSRHHNSRRRAWPVQEEVTADWRHNAYHVPVQLLLREPQGQSTPPAPGHSSHTVGIHWTRREAHQSATGGLHLSLWTKMKTKKNKRLTKAPKNDVIDINVITHCNCLGISFSEEQLSTSEVIV